MKQARLRRVNQVSLRNRGVQPSVACGFLSVAALFLLSGSALAAGGGGGHETTLKDWVWPVINFAILALFLGYFARKPVREFFRKRTELIEQSLREASEAKELAEKSLAEVKKRLEEADTEVNKILEASRRSGSREKEELIAQGEVLKEKLLEQARTTIEFELEKAKKSIKSEAALMALDLAEKQIKESLGKGEQDKLIHDYIEKLEVKK
jgi:F-type H+-transporting ATPase subunit b